MRAAIGLGLLLAAVPLAAHACDEHRSAAVLRAFQRLHPCPANGHIAGACPGWVKDHIIALCDGGADAVANLQWQTVAQGRVKDRAECRHKPAHPINAPLAGWEPKN